MAHGLLRRQQTAFPSFRCTARRRGHVGECIISSCTQVNQALTKKVKEQSDGRFPFTPHSQEREGLAHLSRLERDIRQEYIGLDVTSERTKCAVIAGAQTERRVPTNAPARQLQQVRQERIAKKQSSREKQGSTRAAADNSRCHRHRWQETQYVKS